jgi:hypothetical protein
LDGAVFDHWSYIFGPTQPSISVDPTNSKQLDASQNSGLAFWLAFYKAPPEDPCSYWQSQLDNLSPGDFPSEADYEKAFRWFETQLRECRKKYGPA